MFNVMIVDDTEIFRRDIRRLKVWGGSDGFIITEEAKDGLDALNKLETNPVDLVITDIRMPNMDGIELLRNISEKKLAPFAVLLSDFTEFNYARQGFKYGAFDYIGKPPDEKEISKLLERIRLHMVVKKLEEQKITELQSIVQEVFSAAANISQIIDMICNGDAKAAVMTATMVDTIGASFGYDMNKAMLVLKNTVNELINETLKNHSWISAYFDTDALRNINFADCKDWEEIKAAIIGVEEKLYSFVTRFIGCHDSKIVRQACEYILEHIDEQLSVKTLSERLYISKSYISELFRQKFGVSILEYVTMVKMERAKKLLREEKLKNYEIAYRLGFQDNEYFCKVFKHHTGMSLTEFRQLGTINS